MANKAKDKCNYHLCDHKNKNLSECKYCKHLFCEEHIKPKTPGMPRFKSMNREDYEFMEEWHRSGGHPCPSYVEVFEREREARKEEESKAFNRLLSTSSAKKRDTESYTIKAKDYNEETDKPENENYPIKEEISKPNYKKDKNLDWLKWAIPLLIILIVLGVWYGFYKTASNEISNLPHCSDNTLYDKCSKEKPLYCYNGNLTKKAATCGCPKGYTVEFQDCREISSGNISLTSNKNSSSPSTSFFNKIDRFLKSAIDEIKSSISSTSQQDNIVVVKDFAKGIIDPKSQIDISELEKEVNRLINLQRTNNGLGPLVWDNKLVLIARAHSQDMVNRNFFSHDNPSGEDPTDRANRQGYSCRKDYGSYYTYGLAENIAKTPVYSNVEGCGSTTSLDSLAECIVDGWMTSPGHRENILTKTYTKTGIGIAYSSDDRAYSTQNFC